MFFLLQELFSRKKFQNYEASRNYSKLSMYDKSTFIALYGKIEYQQI